VSTVPSVNVLKPWGNVMLLVANLPKPYPPKSEQTRHPNK
jgi:hypothetical protein